MNWRGCRHFAILRGSAQSGSYPITFRHSPTVHNPLADSRNSPWGSLHMASFAYQRLAVPKGVGTALLVATDEKMVQQFSRSFREMDIVMVNATRVRDAMDLIHGRKFEAFVFDTALDTPFLDLLSEARTSASNSRSVIFALAQPGVSEAARKAGAHFVLEKPIGTENLHRTLRASYGLIVREYRRYFRHRVRLRVLVSTGVTGEIEGEAVDLSEEGIGVRLPYVLAAGTDIVVRFKLATQSKEILARASIAWTGENGMVGLRFLAMPNTMKAPLHEFLSMRLEESIPSLSRKTVALV
jgi:ActR/RegA family two-component response regulator